jgi:phosphate transport system substrate-binding protein
MPSQENARNGSYPVVRKLYMNTRGKPSRIVQAFIDYIRSPAGEAIVKKMGFIPLQ